jgi:hypothetical protein
MAKLSREKVDDMPAFQVKFCQPDAYPIDLSLVRRLTDLRDRRNGDCGCIGFGIEA